MDARNVNGTNFVLIVLNDISLIARKCFHSEAEIRGENIGTFERKTVTQPLVLTHTQSSQLSIQPPPLRLLHALLAASIIPPDEFHIYNLFAHLARSNI
jgi:hypothetical protein